MSEAESAPPAAEPTPSPQPRPPSRLRRFFLRHLPLSLAGALVLLAVTLAGLYIWASSPGFEDFVRRQIVAKLETATGGRVEIGSFHWHLLGLEAEADGLVIHGLEAPGEEPYAQAEKVRVGWNMLGFWIPSFPLRELIVYRPHAHLIVYPDGTTNQPHPRKPHQPGKPVIDSLFDLKTKRIALQEGYLDYDNRAADFDFQNRRIPLDLTAKDVFLRIAFVPATRVNPELYRVEAEAGDLNLARGPASKPRQTVQGSIQATLELTRSAATLRSLRLTASGHNVKERTLEVTGSLDNFAHPHWQGKATGELDLRLVDAMTGYPFTPEGLAHLELAGAGESSSFRVDGSIHVDQGSYIGTGVVATGFEFNARIHADPEQLLVNSMQFHLRQGGQIDGDLTLDHWLPPLPGAASLRPSEASKGKNRGARSQPAPVAKLPPSTDAITIPVNGKVTAEFKNVALNTLLGMLCDPPFQNLGFDARVNGPADAHWIDGDNRTLAVAALLALTAPTQAAPGLLPAGGLIDATYTQRDGAVDLRKLELDLPSSQIAAHGHLGAYPLVSRSAFAVEFHSANLGEFDTVLRDLELTRNGKSGSAALPVVLGGRMDFINGFWAGSLVDPHLSGDVKATQLSVEVPSTSAHSQPLFAHLDSVEATGRYSAARIDLSRGLLRSGKGKIEFSGSLATAAAPAAHGIAPIPTYDANSVLRLRLRAEKFGLDDLRPWIGRNLPIEGTLDAQLQADGPMHALNGSGWVEMDKGSLLSEPFDRIRAQGTIDQQTLNLTSLTVSDEAGKIAVSGSYGFESHRFQLNAMSAGIDVARIDVLRRQGIDAAGELGFSVRGQGTLDDPRLELHASLPALAFNGVPLGDLELTAHTANRAVTYDLTTRLEAADLTAHGQTALGGDYATQAKVDFSRFNIGALLKLAHMQGIGGDSSLAGTITVEGPLARPDDLRGEARLAQLAVTLAGIRLQSEGGLHATLDHSTIHLDPIHITGNETDLRLQGTLSLRDRRQLDLAANGAINLKVAETLKPDLTSSGNSTFQIEAHGPLMNPDLRGRVEIQDAAFSLEDASNGLSQLHGSLEFSQNRLEIKSLTAMSGGGLLKLAGYLAYRHGIFANLVATASGIRIRYPQGISSLADASLQLQGMQNNLLLSGDVLITRFTVSPDLDIAALAAQTAAVETIAPLDSPSNHIRLDVHIGSSPQLNFQNAYAKLAGNVDLRLRGTVASPSLLGRVSITEGSGIIAGTRYDLQRGDIYFTNPVRIEPSIDLSATARVEDYDITLGLHGTLDNRGTTVTYRSDPPLPEADVVALLALGRTSSQQRLYTQQQQQALANPTTDALLGGALNATVSSRVQKLFGAGSVKVDPNYLGALGNSTSRIIVEEQLGRNLTLTYATNVNTTSQQLLQADVAINRHVTLQLARDESGVFSVVLKATRRYR